MLEEKAFLVTYEEDAPDMPEECPESVEALEELSSASQEEKFTFINIIVLSIVLLACAAYFIAMTSSKGYGDEGNKFSIERLASGQFTAEISRRYYSTIAYPEEIASICESMQSFYGLGGSKKSSGTKDPDITPEPGGDGGQDVPVVTSDGRGDHKESEVTAESTKVSDDNGEQTSATKEVQTFYDTEFVRTTTQSTSLDFDPDNPYPITSETEESTTTTTNNDPPDIESTTTAERTSPTETVSEETETVTSEETVTETVTESTSETTEKTEETSKETKKTEDESSAKETDSSKDESKADSSEKDSSSEEESSKEDSSEADDSSKDESSGSDDGDDTSSEDET